MDLDAGAEALLRQRVAKAETEALKATNERLAADKRAQSAKEELEGRVADLRDELALRDAHVTSLERERQDIARAVAALGAGDDVAQIRPKVTELVQQSRDAADVRQLLAAALPSSSSSQMPSLHEAANSARQRLSELEALSSERLRLAQTSQTERNHLKAELEKAHAVEASLTRREKELAAAKRRIKRLSSTLRKSVPSWVVGSTSFLGSGDASSTSLGAGEETMGGESVAGARDFETDMLDEMEQLISYVEELDHRLEFQKVEGALQRKSAEAKCVDLQADKDRLSSQVVSLETEGAAQNTKLLSVQHELDSVKSRMSAEVAQLQLQVQEASSLLDSERAAMQVSLEELNNKLVEVQRTAQKSDQDAQSNAEALQMEVDITRRKLEEQLLDIQQRAQSTETELRKQLAAQEQAARDNEIQSSNTIMSLQAELVKFQQSAEQSRIELSSMANNLQGLKETLDQKCCELTSAQTTISVLEEDARRSSTASARESDVINQEHDARLRELRQKLGEQERLAHELAKSYDDIADGLLAELRARHEESDILLQASASHAQQLALSHSLKEAGYQSEMESLRSSTEQEKALLLEQVESSRHKIKELKDVGFSTQVELDQERTNRRLAEDALNQYVPTQDADVTINLDASSKPDESRPGSIDAEDKVNMMQGTISGLQQALKVAGERTAMLEGQKAQDETALAFQKYREEASEEILSLEDQLSQARARVEDAESLSEDFKGKMLAQVEKRNEVLQELVAQQEEIVQICRERDELQCELDKVREDCGEKACDLLDHRVRYQEVENQLMARQSDIQKLHVELDHLRTVNKSATPLPPASEAGKDQVSQLKARVDALQEELRQREATAAEGERQKETFLAAQIESLRSEMDAECSSCESWQAEVESLRAHSKELDELRNTNTELKQLIADAEIALQESNTREKGLRNERGELQEDLNSVSYALAKAQKEAKKAQHTVSTLKGQLLKHKDADAANADANAEGSTSKLEAALKEVAETKSALVDSTEQKIRLQQQVDEIKFELETARALMNGTAKSDSSGASGAPGSFDELRERYETAMHTIEQMQQELAVRAQECEVADDKELALRKDNKRLASKLSSLQAKVEKLQTQVRKRSQSGPAPEANANGPRDGDAKLAGHRPPMERQTSTPKVAVEVLKPSDSSHSIKDSNAARKRPSPDQDESNLQEKDTEIGLREVSRGYVYAPGPAQLSTPSATPSQVRTRPFANVPARRSKSHESPAGQSSRSGLAPHSRTPLSHRKPSRASPGQAQGMAHVSGSEGLSSAGPVSSAKPSDLIALRMQESGASAQGTARLRDRTNMPREAGLTGQASTKGGPGMNGNGSSRQDNPFMAKLNRFKAPVVGPTPAFNMPAKSLARGPSEAQ